MSGSEVFLLKQKIAEEYIAATLGLSGLAYGTAQHQFIIRHMEVMGQEEAGRMIAEALQPL